MHQIATYPPLSDGPRSPWRGEMVSEVDEFLRTLPFNPSQLRLWYEGSAAALDYRLTLPANNDVSAGTLYPLAGWELTFRRGAIPARQNDWLVLEGPCSKEQLLVLARLLEGVTPVDRRDLSVTVWQGQRP